MAAAVRRIVPSDTARRGCGFPQAFRLDHRLFVVQIGDKETGYYPILCKGNPLTPTVRPD